VKDFKENLPKELRKEILKNFSIEDVKEVLISNKHYL